MRTKWEKRFARQINEKERVEPIKEEPQSEFERQLRDLDDNGKLNQVEVYNLCCKYQARVDYLFVAMGAKTIVDCCLLGCVLMPRKILPSSNIDF